MKSILFFLAMCIALPALAQTDNFKPGLWEVQTTRQVVDGKDMTAQINAAMAMLQKSMANMTPEQRQQLDAKLGGNLPGNTGSVRVCISPDMAAKKEPWVGRNGNCAPTNVTHNGNTVQFDLNCSNNGRTTTGKGTTTYNGDTVTSLVDLTVTNSGHTHTMQSGSSMTYLGSDCQGVPVLDADTRKQP